MPHILVYDEHGNVIGAEEHDPGTDGGAGQPLHEDHEATKLVLNMGLALELQKKAKKEKDD